MRKRPSDGPTTSDRIVSVGATAGKGRVRYVLDGRRREKRFADEAAALTWADEFADLHGWPRWQPGGAAASEAPRGAPSPPKRQLGDEPRRADFETREGWIEAVGDYVIGALLSDLVTDRVDSRLCASGISSIISATAPHATVQRLSKRLEVAERHMQRARGRPPAPRQGRREHPHISTPPPVH